MRLNTQKASEEQLIVKKEVFSVSDSSLKEENDIRIKLEYEKKNLQRSTKISMSKKISKKQKPRGKATKVGKKSARLKNIAKNYGKSCIKFAISELAQEYRLAVLEKEKVAYFKEWVKVNGAKITNIANFRAMLVITERDNKDIALFKTGFKYISEIFIRDFSFNWIFHSSRINDVKGYLFARFKMLRRIQNPQKFTYIH